MVSRGSMTKMLVTRLGEQFFVTEDDVFLGDTGVRSRGDGSRVRSSQVADDENLSWRERRVHAYELFSRGERNSEVRGHRSVPVGNSSHPTLQEFLN